jgi:hypothetical protein
MQRDANLSGFDLITIARLHFQNMPQRLQTAERLIAILGKRPGDRSDGSFHARRKKGPAISRAFAFQPVAGDGSLLLQCDNIG